MTGHGTATIFSNESAPQYAWGHNSNSGNNTPMSIDTVLNTSTISGDYVTASGTGNNSTSTIHYYSPVVLLTNITVNDLNMYGANKFVEQVKQQSSNITGTVGYGSYVSNGSFSFTPLENAYAVGNSSSFVNLSFALNPGMLTENASDFLMVKLSFSNATASF